LQANCGYAIVSCLSGTKVEGAIGELATGLPLDCNEAIRGIYMIGRNRVVAACAIGTYIEWYDFYLYGASSALVFDKLFFPQFDPMISKLLSLLTFSTGFLARPLGGYICGYLGDRYGRKNTLLGTMVAMGVATFLMGLAPTYDVAGVWGAVMLVGLRVWRRMEWSPRSRG
jgi:MFS family permease